MATESHVVVDPDVGNFTGELLSPRTTPRVPENDREERIASEVSAFFKDLDNDFSARSQTRSYNLVDSHSTSKIPVLNMEDDSFRYTATGMLVQKSMEIPIIVQWPDSTFEFTFSSEPSNIKFGISFIAAVEEDEDIEDVDIEVIEEMRVLKPPPSSTTATTIESEREKTHATLTHQYNPYSSPFLNSISSRIDSDGTLVHTGRFTAPDCGVVFFMFDVDDESNWYSPFMTQEYKLSYIIDVLMPSFTTIDNERSKLARYLMNSNDETSSSDMIALEDSETAIRRTLEETLSIEREVDDIISQITQQTTDKDILVKLQHESLIVIEEGYSKVNGLCLRLLNRFLLSKVISYLQPQYGSDLSSVCKYWAKLISSNRLFGLPERTVTDMIERVDGEDDSEKRARREVKDDDVEQEREESKDKEGDTLAFITEQAPQQQQSIQSQQAQSQQSRGERVFSRPLQHVPSSIKALPPPTHNTTTFNTPSTMTTRREQEEEETQFRTKSTAELMEWQLQKMRAARESNVDDIDERDEGRETIERDQERDRERGGGEYPSLSPNRIAKNNKIRERGTYLDDTPKEREREKEKGRKRSDTTTVLPTGSLVDLSEIDPFLAAKLQQYLAKMDKVLREKKRLKKILLLWTENFKLKYGRDPKREDKVEFAEGYYNEYNEQKKKSKQLLILIERLTANMKAK